MPTQVMLCPHCGGKLRLPEEKEPARDRYRCSHCRSVIPSSALSETLNSAELQSAVSTAESPVDPSQKQNQDSSPSTLGRFEIVELLGEGGFGAVYKARDTLLDRTVALKIPKFSPSDQRKKARFLREAKSAASLSHPNIVGVYDSGEIGGVLFIASEFVDGKPLSENLASFAGNHRKAVSLVRLVADALATAHKAGIIHRDIKPHNILLDQAGTPRLADFGLAKRLSRDATMTGDGALLGTPAYMSPEQARGERLGPATDQYSLGVVLFELLSGRRPFSGPPHTVLLKVAASSAPKLREIDSKIPRSLECVCAKAMHRDLAERYSSMEDFAADLERWLSGKRVLALPATRRSRSLVDSIQTWRKNSSAVFVGSLVVFTLVLAILSGGMFFWKHLTEKRDAVVPAAIAQAKTQEVVSKPVARPEPRVAEPEPPVFAVETQVPEVVKSSPSVAAELPSPPSETTDNTLIPPDSPPASPPEEPKPSTPTVEPRGLELEANLAGGVIDYRAHFEPKWQDRPGDEGKKIATEANALIATKPRVTLESIGPGRVIPEEASFEGSFVTSYEQQGHLYIVLSNKELMPTGSIDDLSRMASYSIQPTVLLADLVIADGAAMIADFVPGERITVAGRRKRGQAVGMAVFGHMPPMVDQAFLTLYKTQRIVHTLDNTHTFDDIQPMGSIGTIDAIAIRNNAKDSDNRHILPRVGRTRIVGNASEFQNTLQGRVKCARPERSRALIRGHVIAITPRLNIMTVLIEGRTASPFFLVCCYDRRAQLNSIQKLSMFSLVEMEVELLSSSDPSVTAHVEGTQFAFLSAMSDGQPQFSQLGLPFKAPLETAFDVVAFVVTNPPPKSALLSGGNAAHNLLPRTVNVPPDSMAGSAEEIGVPRSVYLEGLLVRIKENKPPNQNLSKISMPFETRMDLRDDLGEGQTLAESGNVTRVLRLPGEAHVVIENGIELILREEKDFDRVLKMLPVYLRRESTLSYRGRLTRIVPPNASFLMTDRPDSLGLRQPMIIENASIGIPSKKVDQSKAPFPDEYMLYVDRPTNGEKVSFILSTDKDQSRSCTAEKDGSLSVTVEKTAGDADWKMTLIFKDERVTVPICCQAFEGGFRIQGNVHTDEAGNLEVVEAEASPVSEDDNARFDDIIAKVKHNTIEKIRHRTNPRLEDVMK